MHVSLSALEKALQFVLDLAEMEHPAAFGERALPGLAQLVSCDHLTYNELGLTSDQMEYNSWPADMTPPVGLTVFAAHVHEHPLVNYYRTTGDGQPIRISDFLGRERFHRLGLYAEFFRYFPVEHQLAIALPSQPPQVIGIALNRSSGDFSDADRDLLAVLRGPMTTAMERARAREQARQALTAADSELADLTDRELRVLQLTAQGRTNGAIAHALDVSPRTVAKHLEHIYRKLGVSSRAAAVYRASTLPGHHAAPPG
jgi:DNA-binding CsgD family transcriptional regulator